MKVAFVDAAGGSGGDSMTVAWAHAEGKTAILDAVIERRPPFSPQASVEEFAEILKRQGITRVTGDRFSGEFVREMFRKQGVAYEVSTRTKSEIYAAFAVLANSGLVQIPLHRRLLSQLQRLERRVMRGTGREVVDHAPGAHDDLCNSACGALVLASETAGKRREPQIRIIDIRERETPQPAPKPLAASDPGPERWWRRFGGGGQR